MNIDIENKDQLEKWKTEAEGSSFFGYSLKELDRDGLLAIIGHLVEESSRNTKFNQEYTEFLKTCRNRKL